MTSDRDPAASPPPDPITMPELSRQSRHIFLLATIGLIGAVVLPWYVIPSGFWEFGWIGQFGVANTSPLFLQALLHGRWQLLPVGLCLLIPTRRGIPARGTAWNNHCRSGWRGLVLDVCAGLSHRIERLERILA